jgi:hypothetical protein
MASSAPAIAATVTSRLMAASARVHDPIPPVTHGSLEAVPPVNRVESREEIFGGGFPGGPVDCRVERRCGIISW